MQPLPSSAPHGGPRLQASTRDAGATSLFGHSVVSDDFARPARVPASALRGHYRQLSANAGSRCPVRVAIVAALHGCTRNVLRGTFDRSVIISVPSGVPGRRPFPPG